MPAASPIRSTAPGERVGPYEVLDVIAEGAMGRVCRARMPSRSSRRPGGTVVALKVLRHDVADGEELVARFLRETELAGQLAHPHVASLLDAGEDSGRFYLAMEYIEGESLGRFLARAAPLDPAALLDVLLPVCAALAHVHDAGIVHRDVKPDNVLLARAAGGLVRPVLLDFGVAKSVRAQGAAITRASLTLGTPQFMAPEQTRGARFIEARSDQYALAVMLYQGLTGALPHRAADVRALMKAIADGRPDPPRWYRPDLAPALEAVVLRALAREPAGRYPDVRAFALALLPFASPEARARWAPVFRGEAACDAAALVRVPDAPGGLPDAPDVCLVDDDVVLLPALSEPPPAANAQRWDADLPAPARPRPTAAPPLALPPTRTALEVDDEPALAATSSGVRRRSLPEVRRRPRGLVACGLALAALVAALVAWGAARAGADARGGRTVAARAAR